MDLNLKSHINIPALLQVGATTLLSNELQRYDIPLTGLCKSRWPGHSKCVVDDHHFVWSGLTDGLGQCCTVLIIPKHLWGLPIDGTLPAETRQADFHQCLCSHWCPRWTHEGQILQSASECLGEHQSSWHIHHSDGCKCDICVSFVWSSTMTSCHGHFVQQPSL